MPKIGPRIWLTFLCLSFGVVSIGMGFTKTWTDFLVCRILLGITEAGFLPGTPFPRRDIPTTLESANETRLHVLDFCLVYPLRSRQAPRWLLDAFSPCQWVCGDSRLRIHEDGWDPGYCRLEM